MIRAAQAKSQPAGGGQAAGGVPVIQVVRALNTATCVAPAWRSRDWAGVREGVQEVFLTLAATVAIGFGWAAIEVGRIDPLSAPVAASGIENRYDGEPMAGR